MKTEYYLIAKSNPNLAASIDICEGSEKFVRSLNKKYKIRRLVKETGEWHVKCRYGELFQYDKDHMACLYTSGKVALRFFDVGKVLLLGFDLAPITERSELSIDPHGGEGVFYFKNESTDAVAKVMRAQKRGIGNSSANIANIKKAAKDS